MPKRGSHNSESKSNQRNGRTWKAGILLLVVGGLAAGFIAVNAFRHSPKPADESESTVNVREPTKQQIILNDLERDVRRLIDKKSAAVSAKPSDASAHGDLGLAFAANDMWPEAKRAFDEAVQLDETNKHWRLYQAIAMRQSGDRDASVAMLRKLALAFPDLVPAQQRLGHALLEEGDLDGANRAFQQVVKIKPTLAEGFVGLGEVRLQQNQLDQAIVLLRQAVKLDSTYGVAHFLLGTAYQRSNQPKLAEPELKLGQRATLRYLPDKYSTVLEQYSVTVRARHQRAIRLMSKRQFDAAANVLQLALETDQDNVAMINLLAGAHMQLKRNSEAFELLKKAERLDNRKSTTHINLAAWYFQNGQPEQALNHANRAVELADWVVTGHITRVTILIQLKRWKDAKSALKQALTIAPEHATLQQMCRQLDAISKSE